MRRWDRDPVVTACRRSAAVLTVVLMMGLAIAAHAQAKKEAPPAGGQPRPFQLPNAEEFSLPNGLRVTMVPWGTVPKVAVRVVVQAGNANEAENQVWLADVVGDLIKEGTPTRNAEAIAREAARLGGSINVSVGLDQTFVQTDVLSEFGPEAVALLADLIQNPALPEAELPRLKADAVRRMTIARTQPQQIALERFRKLLYPQHAYGRIFPTEAMLNGFTIEDARRFYKQNFGAARAHIYVVGRFQTAAMRQAVEKAFSGWAKGPAPLVNVPKTEGKRLLELVDRPGAAQSTLYIGLPVIDPSHPEYVPLQVMNTLLGGFFSSRITANIREQKGYTYSPVSQVSARYRDAYWVQIADVTTAVTGPSLKEIFYEIDRLQQEPPSAQELQGTKNYLAGVFVLQNSSRSGIINQLTFVNLHGLGREYLEKYVQRVHAVTPEDVQRLAKQYLQPGKMTIVVVGDREKIADQIAPYQQAGD